MSSHHFAETLALGLAGMEFKHFGSKYAGQVVANAQLLGRELLDRDFEVVGDDPDITQTHQLWVRIGEHSATDALAEALASVGVRVNVQMNLPNVPGPVFRLGTNEITFQGAGPEPINRLADCFAFARDGNGVAASQCSKDVRRLFGAPYYFTDLAC